MSSKKTEFDNISFDLPKNQSNVIKVIGVGGGGSNAINHMFSQGIKGVDFVICNTDSQALENSPVPNKIQLGVSLTEGLGAGANPKVGEQSAVESMEEIRSMLTTNTKMIFITAGMGGGTGTGAAPIIAKMAKDMDILTVGIVTIPFQFEGKTRNEQAHIGVEKLRQNVDSLVVINNNKLREVYGNLGFKAGFSKADEVLATAARGIAEVITHHYTQNIDLRDAKTVLANSGTAIMGSSTASGANRAKEAIGRALDSPLLNDNKIKGAKNVLLLIVSGSDEITIDEIGEISDHIQNEAGHSANIIMGVGEEESLEGSISITVIATGFNFEQQNEIVNTETKKIIHTLEDEQKSEHNLTPKSTGTSVNLPQKSMPSQTQTEAPVVKHTLFDNEEIEEKLPFEGYIKTSELLKNLGVSFEEFEIEDIETYNQVEVNKINVNEFVIIETPKKQDEEKKTSIETASEEMEDQILMFDMPINVSPKRTLEQDKKDERVYLDLEEIEVKDHVEIIPITEVTGGGIKRYSLDDYQEVEDRLNSAKPSKAVNMDDEDEEIIFEKRTVSEPDSKEEDSKDEDPLNSPIAKILSDRTEERKRKMKEFNYKFKNSPSRIDEIEKQPAYKRMGIDLNETKNEPNISRTSINTEDDEIELRKNNSFLHDNVD
ncbi:cell division protein FtsZ [Aequorivita sublithincola DSM 14238]|uniref:Cell division protein FtsZ n=1 Tax=Aequorivita sublithincola (strain DSM 14238 / LMG 21431 / ACAM 643 / 9-3) TaxID=746697 RepID=I3YWJ1_AEQSU|nr:cell division protein FtsZ [Aequorivita sublithincola]AFL81359.1 cell division protein FtsZ [Aequorivita sublithincola DSM 14238]